MSYDHLETVTSEIDPITNSVEQGPSWESESRSASQQIPRLLCISEVHYRVHNSQPPVRILSHV
jgi:hypothetical protein